MSPWPWVVGQATGGSSGDVTELVTLATQIGLSSIFLWQWRNADKERKEKDATILGLTDKFGGALKDAVDTVAELQAALSTQVQKLADSPDRKDLDVSIRRLELLVDVLTQRRRREDYDQ